MTPNRKLQFFLFIGALVIFHLSFFVVDQVGRLVYTPVGTAGDGDKEAQMGMNMFYLILQLVLFIVISISSFSISAQILINQKDSKLRFDLVDMDEKVVIRDRFVQRQVLMRQGLIFFYFLCAFFVFLDLFGGVLLALKLSPVVQLVIAILVRLIGFWLAILGTFARSGSYRLIARPRVRKQGISARPEMG